MGRYDPGYLALAHPWATAVLLLGLAGYCLFTGVAIFTRHAKADRLLELWTCLLLIGTIALAVLFLAGHFSQDSAYSRSSNPLMIASVALIQVIALFTFLIFLRSPRGRGAFQILHG
jgi:phosphoglycerol transferase MdoB-like AlkP superfamily enzyme